MAKTSITEQALLQFSQLEEAAKKNAKGILASTMKQELKNLLKESIEDEEDDLPDGEENMIGSNDSDKKESDSENTLSTEDEDDSESPFGDTEDDEDEDDSESPFGDTEDDEDETIDATKFSDPDVIKVFKALSPEDNVIVTKDDDTIQFTDGNGEDYIIKLSEGEDGDDDTIYEIELPGDESHQEEVDEASRTKSNVHGDKDGQDRAGLKSKKKYKAGSDINQLNEEIKKLKLQNTEYKKALILFKDKLNEVAIFNANLAYSNKLFTEHSTTKQEKLNVLGRFDNVKTLSESKNLYQTIKSELNSKKTVTETVAEKITNTVSTSVSKETLSESKAFENPEFARIRDLMSKLKK